MAGLSVRDRRQDGATLVSNRFIDRLLPDANGEFVKVYLLLLRKLSEGRELSVSYMADKLNNTEKDVVRALKYWEKMKVLKLEYEETDLLSGLELLPEDFGETAYMAEEPEREQPAARHQIPQKQEEQKEKPADLEELQDDEDFSQLLDLIGCYVGKILTSRECEVLANLYANVGMSAELLEYLVEYCVSNGHKSMRYIETVALNWNERGIETVEQARNETVNGGKNTYAVLKAFGLGGRNPAEVERTMIDRWFRDYSFPVDIVLEACDRTMRTIHQPSFEYADKILKEWKEKGVRAVEDIARLDEKPEGGRETKKKEKGKQGMSPSGNFPQRDYDCDELVKEINGF
ncbi:MAG: DnaD domain protein [Lachnospiraceae bacterium]|nr:DnaD domain protein [Lachnospiraceae bacterium]